MTASHPIDPSFLALPYRRMAEAALARAQDFHVTHADFRFERIRSQDVRVRDGRLQGAADSEDLGFAVRVILDGAWGFASGVVLTPESAVQVTETGGPHRAGGRRDDHRAGRSWPPSRCTATSPGSRPTTSTRSPCPLADKVGAALRLDRASCSAADGGRRTPTRRCKQVVENKFYADLAGTSTTQQRVRLQPDVEVLGSRPEPAACSTRCAPSLRRSAAAGSTSPATGYDWAAELGRAARAARARSSRAPSVEAGDYDLVDRPVATCG